jgi:Protein of unknown function (DUF3347)
MKQLIILIGAASVILACNSNKSSNQESKPDAVGEMKDTAMQTARAVNENVPSVSPTFTNVNAALSVAIKNIVDEYLQIKNALVNNSGNDAASGGKEMYEAMDKIDKSMFTADQKKIYDDIEDDLKEHAEHISKNSGHIAHQREHFSMMSEDVYDLVKAFGGGRPLYHDHCPMANENRGAIWLSETKEVKNPYFGGKMNECVKVMEQIQ